MEYNQQISFKKGARMNFKQNTFKKFQTFHTDFNTLLLLILI